MKIKFLLIALLATTLSCNNKFEVTKYTPEALLGIHIGMSEKQVKRQFEKLYKEGVVGLYFLNESKYVMKTYPDGNNIEGILKPEFEDGLLKSILYKLEYDIYEKDGRLIKERLIKLLIKEYIFEGNYQIREATTWRKGNICLFAFDFTMGDSFEVSYSACETEEEPIKPVKRY